jgi:hypothetical protein
MVTTHVSPDVQQDLSGLQGTVHVRTSKEYHPDYHATPVRTPWNTVRTLYTETPEKLRRITEIKFSQVSVRIRIHNQLITQLECI